MVVDRSKSVVNRSHRRAIGTFPNRRAAEQALHELKDSGFPMDRVSVVAQDADRKGRSLGLLRAIIIVIPKVITKQMMAQKLAHCLVELWEV
jgi:hypothetical protein